MKFLCLDCDEGMSLMAAEGPEQGSLSVSFACPSCGHRVAMLTNPEETNVVRALGVQVGGPPGPRGPMAHVRATLGRQRADGRHPIGPLDSTAVGQAHMGPHISHHASQINGGLTRWWFFGFAVFQRVGG